MFDGREERKREMDEKKIWRKVQVGKCIRALLIFIGIILMQLLAYMLCALGYGLVQMMHGVSAIQATQQLADYMTDTGSSLLIWVSAVSASLSLIWCGILYHQSEWRDSEYSYRGEFTMRRLGYIVGTGFGGCVTVSVILSMMAAAFPTLFSQYNEIMSHVDVNNSWVTAIYVLFIGPVSEEVIFRGAIMDRLKIAFPFWVANLLQAALFGLYHMNLVQGIYAFLLGVVLGLVCQTVGSIYANILAHILFNATSYIIGLVFTGKYAWEGTGMLLLFIISILAFGYGITGLYRAYRQKYSRNM